MRTVSINLDTLDVREDAPAFTDVDRALLREIDAFIKGERDVPSDDEVASIDAIMAAYDDNPFA